MKNFKIIACLAFTKESFFYQQQTN